MLGPSAVEGLLRDTYAAGGLNDRAAAGNDHLRLPELVDDFLRRVFPLWLISSLVLSRIQKSILDRFSEVRSVRLAHHPHHADSDETVLLGCPSGPLVAKTATAKLPSGA